MKTIAPIINNYLYPHTMKLLNHPYFHWNRATNFSSSLDNCKSIYILLF